MATPNPNLFTVIFLYDALPIQKIVLLHRSSRLKFAPSMYTGIGGKVDEEDSDHVAGARRELKEETGISETVLTEFGRLILNKQKTLFYFISHYPYNSPLPTCTDGNLEWTSVEDLFSKNIIPTTKTFLEEWQKRNWEISPTFTVHAYRALIEDINSPISSLKVSEGLA